MTTKTKQTPETEAPEHHLALYATLQPNRASTLTDWVPDLNVALGKMDEMLAQNDMGTEVVVIQVVASAHMAIEKKVKQL